MTRRRLLHFCSVLPALIGFAAASDAAVTSISESDLDGFSLYPKAVQSLIKRALALTRLRLTYTFASADPARGGMDCSGAIYYLLQKEGFHEVPRQSDGMAIWLREAQALQRTQNVRAHTDAALSKLKPGDLVFWSGTYDAKKRRIPVTHVMLYLGRLKTSSKPVLFGASDGRRYEGQRRKGVSVFDFAIPKPGSSASLYGYGSIPGLRR